MSMEHRGLSAVKPETERHDSPHSPQPTMVRPLHLILHICHVVFASMRWRVQFFLPGFMLLSTLIHALFLVKAHHAYDPNAHLEPLFNPDACDCALMLLDNDEEEEYDPEAEPESSCRDYTYLFALPSGTEANMDEFRACSTPDAASQEILNIRIIAGNDGRVSEANFMLQSDQPLLPAQQCMLDHVHTWKFPSPPCDTWRILLPVPR